jgi:catechol 2,3-dioxygenase-like lactoylglutathione lyase family enzyme
MRGLYPLVLSDRMAEARAFYEGLFGLRAVFDNGWFVLFQAEGNPLAQIAFIEPDHGSIPIPFRRAAAGVLLTLEADDVDAAFLRARERGVAVLFEPRDEEWGQRHFMLVDPHGLLVDVVAEIAVADTGPTAEATGT